MREWLKDIRKKESLTQAEVAMLTGVNITLIGKYELSKRRPSPEVAKRLEDKLNFQKYGYDWTKFYEDEMTSFNNQIPQNMTSAGRVSLKANAERCT